MIGDFILAVIAIMAGIIGVKNSLSSYMIVNNTFGSLSAMIVNVAISMFLFFAINAELFNTAAPGVIIQLAGWKLDSPIFFLTYTQ